MTLIQQYIDQQNVEIGRKLEVIAKDFDITRQTLSKWNKTGLVSKGKRLMVALVLSEKLGRDISPDEIKIKIRR
jgi:transposase-like protein